jgi:hypothetical protein
VCAFRVVVGLKDCYFTFTMVDQGLRRSRRMQGLDPEVQEPQHDSSNEGMVEEKTSETRSVAPGSGQHMQKNRSQPSWKALYLTQIPL